MAVRHEHMYTIEVNHLGILCFQNNKLLQSQNILKTYEIYIELVEKNLK